MSKAKLKARLRKMKAEWCVLDEVICSLIDLTKEPAISSGIDKGYLQSKPNGERVEIFFKSEEFLEELKRTTCAFTGKVIH